MKAISKKPFDSLKEWLPPIFSTKDALPFLSEHYGAPEKKLLQMEKQGAILRIQRGYYCFNDLCDRFLMAGMLNSPSYISYETALSYYGMIPEKVEGVYSVVHGRSAELCTPFGEFIYRAQNLELYALGMDMIFIESYPVLMATKEKAMLDTLAQHALHASKLSGETIFEYVVQNLRVEPSSLTTLSLKKLKPLAFRYRNFGPRKLYAHLEILQNRLTT